MNSEQGRPRSDSRSESRLRGESGNTANPGRGKRGEPGNATDSATEPEGSSNAVAQPSAREFSVIVPALNEEAQLEETLLAARAALGPDVEVIVVDGCSQDRTKEIAAKHGTAIAAKRCRGAQLQAGARAATGGILVFLHADTRLPPGSAAAIRSAVAAGAGAGCFRFALHPTPRAIHYRVLEKSVNWRTHFFKTATGDQAIFAARAAYDACGGFPAFPVLEDVAFVQAVSSVTRFQPLSLAARTSSRRWDRGFARTVFTHLTLRAAFALGADPHRLNRYYYGKKSVDASASRSIRARLRIARKAR